MGSQIAAYRRLKAGQVLTRSLRYGVSLYEQPKGPNGRPRPAQFKVFAYIQDRSVASGIYEELARALRQSAKCSTRRRKGRLDLADTDQCWKLADWLERNLDSIARPHAAAAWVDCVRATRTNDLNRRRDVMTALKIAQTLEPPIPLCDQLTLDNHADLP